MCLDRPIRTKERKYFKYEKSNRCFVGYKIYNGKGKNHTKVTPTNSGKMQSLDRWINEKEVRHNPWQNDISFGSCRYFKKSYPTGFHFYPTLEIAEKALLERSWRPRHIRKIYFERAVIRGMQQGLPVAVTKNIYISKD